MFSLCSLIADWGWRQDRYSLILVPSVLAVSPIKYRSHSGQCMSYTTPHFAAFAVLSFGCTNSDLRVLIGLW